MKRLTLWILTIIALNACGQSQIESTYNVMDKFEIFIQKEKFVEDGSILYPGIADTALLPVLTEKINQAAKDFKEIALKGNPTDKDYQDQIKNGLQRFNIVYLYLDTEDRERVCHYFEELMDIVGLKSSGGLLNNFMYGIAPEEIKK